MTSQATADVVRTLVAFDAETIALESANETAEKIGLVDDVAMYISVATPGMWTDRLGTEVGHRLKATDPAGILIWFDDQVTEDHIREQVIAQTVRLGAVIDRQGGLPAGLKQGVRQEGTALALAGKPGEWNQDAADILAFRAGDPSLATMVAYLYGDKAAVRMGYTPVGLDDRVGYLHSIALYSS